MQRKWAQPGFEPGACHIEDSKNPGYGEPEATIIPLDH
jgi:hypothetical protein